MVLVLPPRAAPEIGHKFPMQRSLTGTIVTFGTSHPSEIIPTFVRFPVHNLMIIETVCYSFRVIIAVSQIHTLDFLLSLPHSQPQDFGWPFLFRHQPGEIRIH